MFPLFWLSLYIDFFPSQVNLTELKAFPNPPPAVINVAAAVMVLLAPRGRVAKDRSWKAARAFMGKVELSRVSQICLINANLICALALTPALPGVSPVLTLWLDCSMNMLTQGRACDSQPLTVITASLAIKRINLLQAKPSDWS